MVTCIVFDFDGVLVDSNDIKLQAYETIFERFGDVGEIVRECVSRNRSLHRFGVIGRILNAIDCAGIPRDTRVEDSVLISQLAADYNSICEEATATCREIEGASQAIGALSESRALYINSATWEEPLKRVVRRRGWAGYFRNVLGSPRSKEENLQCILTVERTEGASVVFVGDGQNDQLAALAYNCHFVGIQNEHNNFASQPEFLLDDLTQLVSTVNRFK